jgi:hypothetical protein
MKSIAAFIVLALAVLAAAAGSVSALGNACAGFGVVPPPNPLPIEFRVEGGSLAAQPAVLRGEGLARNLIVPVQAAPQTPSWQLRFICSIRPTDIVIAVLALLLMLAVLFQGLWTRAALQEARASTRLVEQTTQIAEQSARVANEGALSAQRPYVFLREFRVNLIKNVLNDEIQTCTIQPIWENTGTTPTRNGRSHVNWKFFERAIPDDFDFPDYDEIGNPIQIYEVFGPLIVGPRATALSALLDIEPSVLRQVRDLQGKLLIWGWAEYDEVFSDSRRHRTEFCYQLVVTGSPASWVGFSQYRAFNGADDDCMRRPTAVTPILAVPEVAVPALAAPGIMT